MASPQEALNNLFDTPRSQKELADADARAQSLLDDVNKVQRALDRLTIATKDELQAATGLSLEAQAKALHYLMTSTPPLVEKSAPVDTRGKRMWTKYRLTDDGRHSLPPPPIPNWHGPDVAPPRKKYVARDRSPQPAATFHLHKLNGKVDLNPDGSLSLRGLMGKIYDCIKDHPRCTFALIQRITGIPTSSIYQNLTTLLNLELISFTAVPSGKEGVKPTRHYSIVPIDTRIAKEKPDDPPASTLPTLPEWVTDPGTRRLNKTLGKLPANDKITEVLYQLHDAGISWSDMVLTIEAIREHELTELENFRDSIINNLPKD
jgi:hypothetical protein